MSGSDLSPALLVAMPQLLDPNFARTVVLLIDHDEGGTFGLVLNRVYAPTHIPHPVWSQSWRHAITVRWDLCRVAPPGAKKAG